MTRITQIEDRGAVVAWSSIPGIADVIALGTKEKGGIGFEDIGGELELYDLNIANGRNEKATLLGSIKTPVLFGSIAWGLTMSNTDSTGILAGGMVNGTVNLWKPSSLLEGGHDGGSSPDATVASVQKHSGAVSALKFNPHADSRDLLASGGGSGEVLIFELENIERPNVYSAGGEGSKGQGAEITQVAWNSQVQHILASSSANGTVVVWDLRQKKPWCELRCEANSSPVSDVAWNPTQGLHMMTASEGGALKLWDLRASTTMPLLSLEGHQGRVLSMDWCPHDDTLLLSCGKDNRTLLWDLCSLQAIAEIPNDDYIPNHNPSNANDLYGGGLGSSQLKRYDVQWSPLRRGVVSTCSFDRKVQIHSVNGLATKCGRPPKWISPSSGISCGFGGVVVSISQKLVTIDVVVDHPELVKASEQLESTQFDSDNNVANCIARCHAVAEKDGNDYESQVWSFMRIMFETNAREELLSYLGFNPEKINKHAMEFGEDGSNLVETKPTPQMSIDAANAVKDALLVGNFEAAVECCFRSNNLADALVLASCGGAELWTKTQADYFAREAKKRPYLSLVSAVVHNQLTELVALSDPSKWKETLAVLSTYGKSEEFPTLCANLGDRLEEVGDFANASLCYMCALNLRQAVKYWKLTLQQANEGFGGIGLLSLHDFVEKVTIFMQTLDSNQDLDDETANLFAKYSNALANQGMLVAAAKYLRGDTQECKELCDRIYRSRMGALCPSFISSPPEFPFNYVNLGVAHDLHGITVKRGDVIQYEERPIAESQPVTMMQQHEHHMLQYQSEEQTPGPSLPPGWIALQDPASGETYYANQDTGESSWEPPQAPFPSPAPIALNGHDGTQAVNTGQSNLNGVASSGILMTQKVATKYGDGFVTSASNPQLAAQYGNIGTSNPYSSANRPGTAAAAVGSSTPKKPPISGTFDPNAVASLSGDSKFLSEGLLALAKSLDTTATSAVEKKQVSESQKGVAIFIKALARGGVEADVVNKVGSMLLALQRHEYGSASSIMTGLVSSEWKDHKDWLKGMKILVQMAAKKQI